jgi:sodium transport system permease protein
VRLANVFVVYRKELKDMLRDRRTIFAMVVFPLVLFPLMTVGFSTLAERSVARVRQQSARVMLLGEEHAPELAQRFRETDGLEIVLETADFARQINEKKLRAAVEFPRDFQQALKSEARKPPQVLIHYYPAEIRSGAAAGRVEEVLRNYLDRVVEERLAARNLPTAILKPFEAKRENVASAEKVGGGKLSGILAYFIIILCLTGASHAAMDLTAGEKERGTLETILASAVSRRELVAGKFLLVMTTSIVTSVLSLASYASTMMIAPSYAHDVTRGHGFTISVKSLAAALLVVLPLAIFFAAALIAISTFAKSYKEAQSYLGPLMLAAILPAIASMLPGVELNAKLALVPVLNVALLIREILTGNYPWLLLSVVFASTCVYAVAALATAVSFFEREDILFRTGDAG